MLSLPVEIRHAVAHTAIYACKGLYNERRLTQQVAEIVRADDCNTYDQLLARQFLGLCMQLHVIPNYTFPALSEASVDELGPEPLLQGINRVVTTLYPTPLMPPFPDLQALKVRSPGDQCFISAEVFPGLRNVRLGNTEHIFTDARLDTLHLQRFTSVRLPAARAVILGKNAGTNLSFYKRKNAIPLVMTSKGIVNISTHFARQLEVLAGARYDLWFTNLPILPNLRRVGKVIQWINIKKYMPNLEALYIGPTFIHDAYEYQPTIEIKELYIDGVYDPDNYWIQQESNKYPIKWKVHTLHVTRHHPVLAAEEIHVYGRHQRQVAAKYAKRHPGKIKCHPVGTVDSAFFAGKY